MLWFETMLLGVRRVSRFRRRTTRLRIKLIFDPVFRQRLTWAILILNTRAGFPLETYNSSKFGCNVVFSEERLGYKCRSRHGVFQGFWNKVLKCNFLLWLEVKMEYCHFTSGWDACTRETPLSSKKRGECRTLTTRRFLSGRQANTTIHHVRIYNVFFRVWIPTNDM